MVITLETFAHLGKNDISYAYFLFFLISSASLFFSAIL